MKKIVFGLIACGAGVVATSVAAAPSIGVTAMPPAQSMIKRTQHFGWPDRPGGPGGWPNYVNTCDAVQLSCADQWQVGSRIYDRCMALRGC